MIRLKNLRLRLIHQGREDGIAIILVIGVSLVLMLLVTVALGVSLSGMTKAKTDEGWNGAITAAYAGVDDYKSKIANDNSYYRFGNPASDFSATSHVTLPTGLQANPAFGVGASGTWATVAGSGGSASYRYEVDSSEYSNSGVLRIRSTGRVGNETRSIVANLKQKGFIDFLYYTTYEVQDWAFKGTKSACEKYAWMGRTQSSGCGEIAFGDGDEMYGPMHSNDTIRICGDAQFYGTVTTGYTPSSGVAFVRRDSNNSTSGCNGEKFWKGNPVTTQTMDLPPTNSAMRNEVRTDLTEVQRPGCLYTGPTKIVFNSDGTMTIRSPWTKKTQVVGSPATGGTAPPECGIPGYGSNTLGAPGGQTITVPARNLIFVQNVPFYSTGTSSDPNAWKQGTYPLSTSSKAYKQSDCLASNFVGYPLLGEEIKEGTSSVYKCDDGDIFVEGNVNAEVTLAAENDVYITGDIKYVSTNEDAVLGLVAQNTAWVWNPMKSCNSSFSSCTKMLSDSKRRIDAAILSVNHTFQVQNYYVGGSRGDLTVNGAIAQKFRGIVRSGSNGYSKDYHYDERFKYIAPPKFLSPVSTTYGVSVLVEVKTAFTPDGTKIS